MARSKVSETKRDEHELAAMSAMMAANPAATKAWLAIATESARFMTDRFREDLETQKAMLACKSPADLLRLQSDFYQKAVEQYAAEATRLFELMSDAAGETVKQAQESHARAFDDIPL